MTLHELAARGLKPLRRRWLREPIAVPTASAFQDSTVGALDAGSSFGATDSDSLAFQTSTTQRDPFDDYAAPGTGELPAMPIFVAEPERWGAVLEAASLEEACPCLFPAGPVSPGRIPDGHEVAGSPLLVQKNASIPTNLDLRWSASCLTAADDYSVHEGQLGVWYSHTSIECSTGGLLSIAVTPAAGSTYLLVVPLSSDAEGSYGVDDLGTDRPVSTTTCRASRVIDPCP